ncbi:MAG: PEGA domain-containing protein [Patescibacteria group bacterium]|nr:PEGA domain-containing protein [Patescibacteria group bacterium]
MEDTNTSPQGSSEEESSRNIPISPEIKLPDPDLSTGGKDSLSTGFPKVNQDTIPSQEAKKEDFYFGNNKVELPKESVTSSPIKEAFQKEEKAKAVMIRKAANPKLKRNLIAAAVAVFLLVLVGGTAYYFYSINKKIAVTVSANQAGFSLLVDGMEYKNITSPYQLILSKGDHIVTARKEGFADLQKTISVSPGNNNYTLSFQFSAYQKIEKVIDKEVFFANYNKEIDSLSYFDKTDAGYNLKEYNFANQKETTMIEAIEQVSKVAWSPTSRQLVVKVTNSAKSKVAQIPYLEKYGDGTKLNWLVNLDRTDLLNITTKDLQPPIKNVSFSPQGDKIVYLFQNDLVKDFAIANPDGSNYEVIIPAIKTVEFEPDVVWSPDGKRVAIFANMENGANSNAKEVNVYAYSFETRTILKITEDGISTGAQFSPDGSKLIYQSGNNIMLYDFSAAEGSTTLDLKLQGNLANCSWIDNQSFVALSSSDNSLMLIKISGVKETVNYQKDTLPGNIKSILSGNGRIYILNNDGVYQLALEKGI